MLLTGECPLADSDSDGEENVEGFNNEDFNNALKNDQQLVKVDGQLFDLTILKADIPSIESSLDDFVGKFDILNLTWYLRSFKTFKLRPVMVSTTYRTT